MRDLGHALTTVIQILLHEIATSRGPKRIALGIACGSLAGALVFTSIRHHEVFARAARRIRDWLRKRGRTAGRLMTMTGFSVLLAGLPLANILEFEELARALSWIYMAFVWPSWVAYLVHWHKERERERGFLAADTFLDEFSRKLQDTHFEVSGRPRQVSARIPAVH